MSEYFRPYTKGAMVPVHYRIPKALANWIEQQDEELGMSPTHFARGILLEAMHNSLYGQNAAKRKESKHAD